MLRTRLILVAVIGLASACKGTGGAELQSEPPAQMATAVALAPPLKLWLGFRRQELPGDDGPGGAAAFYGDVQLHMAALPELRSAHPEINTYVFSLAPASVREATGLGRKLPDALVLEGFNAGAAAVRALASSHWQLFAVGQAQEIDLPQPLLASGSPWNPNTTKIRVYGPDAAPFGDVAELQTRGLRDLIEYKTPGYVVRIMRWEGEIPQDDGTPYEILRGAL